MARIDLPEGPESDWEKMWSLLPPPRARRPTGSAT